MKCQDLFSSENKKKSKLSSALVVIGALRVKNNLCLFSQRNGQRSVSQNFYTDLGIFTLEQISV